MKVQTTRPFDRDFSRLPKPIRARAEKPLALLLRNPRHPSLRLKKTRGTADIWEVRITKGYRLTLHVAGDTLVLRRIGTHDLLERP